MKILAIDLGTKTGWAIGIDGTVVNYGQWDLSGSRFSGGGVKFMEFENRLGGLDQNFDLVVYEIVRRHLGTDAAHAYGGFLAVLQLFCHQRLIPFKGYSVGAIKKTWSGKGNSNKEAMVAEAERRGFEGVTDNMADALAILHLAQRDMEAKKVSEFEQPWEKKGG